MNRKIREKFILETVDKHGDITVNIIVKLFNVSGMTARRDIENPASSIEYRDTLCGYF